MSTSVEDSAVGQIEGVFDEPEPEFGMSKPPFQIRAEKTGELLAQVQTMEALDAWWKLNGARWFGLRVEGQTIIVADMKENSEMRTVVEERGLFILCNEVSFEPEDLHVADVGRNTTDKLLPATDSPRAPELEAPCAGSRFREPSSLPIRQHERPNPPLASCLDSMTLSTEQVSHHEYSGPIHPTHRE
jgi:hypothetical protein